jgi:hypothetical protein
MMIELKRLEGTKWLKGEKRVERAIDHRGALMHASRTVNRVLRKIRWLSLADF